MEIYWGSLNTFKVSFKLNLKGQFEIFKIYYYLLPCQELDEKFNSTYKSVWCIFGVSSLDQQKNWMQSTTLSKGNKIGMKEFYWSVQQESELTYFPKRPWCHFKHKFTAEMK